MGHIFTSVKEGDVSLEGERNRQKLREKLGLNALVFMRQVHGNEVVIITKGDEFPTCDAMISSLTGVGLAALAADCIPILFQDKFKGVIGVAHAGRVGTTLHVGQKTVEKMVEVFGSSVDDVEVFMGPSIQKCCYEVGLEVTAGLEEALHVRNGKYFLDLQSINKAELLDIGIQEKNIEVSSVCTCCDKNYFSYRREGKTGRFCGVMYQ